MPWWVLLSLMWIAGCSRSTPASYWVVSSRFIEEQPGELFSLSKLRRKGKEALRVDFSSPEDLVSWQTADREITEEGLRFTEEGHLDGTVKFKAVEIQGAEVTLQALEPGLIVVSLYWASGDAPFKPRRSMRVRSTGGSGKRVVRLELQKHPRWRGRVDRLRLEIKTPGGLLLQELRAASTRLVSERLPGYLGKPWKVDLGDDVRSGLLAVPGLEITRRVMVPEGGVFRVDYGHLAGSADAVDFEIGIDDGSGKVTLYSDELKPVDTPTSFWREARVDLAQWAGHEVDLILATAADQEKARPLYGVPVWANPEVLAPQAEKPRNVVLISIDTLRADRMSLYGYQRPTTPHLDAWAAESAVVFENAVAQAPWTLPSHTSMLTGLSTLRHGMNHARRLPGRLEMLPETLRAAGYRTLALTGGGYLHPSYHFDQGFDRFRYWSGLDPRTGVRQQLDEELEVLLADASEWVGDHADERFFLFFHTYDIHHRVLPREAVLFDVLRSRGA